MKPVELQQLDDSTLGIVWDDGHHSIYEVRRLRLACRCALCIDEITGSPRIDPKFIPERVHPLSIKQVGRYGLHIEWSDGHNSGYFSFERLRDICECKSCPDTPTRDKNQSTTLMTD